MRPLVTILTIAFVACLSSSLFAWERDTVDRQIARLCEQRNTDDWPGQDECITMQRRSLQTLRPPKNDIDLVASYRACTGSAPSEYDFVYIQHCYDAGSSAILRERSAAREKEVADSFSTLALIVQCSFSDGRLIEIRRRDQKTDAIVAKVGATAVFDGRSGPGYVYEWGGAGGDDFQLDGNQLRDRTGGDAKLFAGKCRYE